MSVRCVIMSETEVDNMSHVEVLLAGISGKEVNNVKVELVEIFAIITLLEKAKYCDANGRDICLFLGPAMSGKKTTLNLLLGNPLKVVMEDDPKVAKLNRRIKLMDLKDKEYFPVVYGLILSEIKIPKKFSITICGNDYDIWYCPGYGNTRGSSLEIICQWLTTRLIETAKAVKLFSFFSADALLQPNAQEFRNYIQQVQDHGLDRICSISQTLVFTKADKDASSDELKESFLYLLSEHFPNSKELHRFFIAAKAIQIKKPGKDEIGNVYTQKHVSSLIDTFDIKEVKARVAVNSEAKLFFYRSTLELARFASETMKDAYKNVYQDKLKNRIDEIFIKQCTERDFMELTQQFFKAKQESVDTISTDPLIIQAETELDKIADFVLAFIPEDSFLKNLMDTNKKAVKDYNDVVVNYITSKKYFNFLETHSNYITDKVELHEMWDSFIRKLEKPEICTLSRNLADLYKNCEEANKEIMKLKEQKNIIDEKKANENLKEYLANAQVNFRKKILRYWERKSGDSDFSLFYQPLHGRKFRVSEPIFPPEAKTASIKNISTILDKSFSQHIVENPLWLLDDIVTDYWEEQSFNNFSEK